MLLEFLISSFQILSNILFLLTSNIPLNTELPAPQHKLYLHLLKFLCVFNDVLNQWFKRCWREVMHFHPLVNNGTSFFHLKHRGFLGLGSTTFGTNSAELNLLLSWLHLCGVWNTPQCKSHTFVNSWHSVLLSELSLEFSLLLVFFFPNLLMHIDKLTQVIWGTSPAWATLSQSGRT